MPGRQITPVQRCQLQWVPALQQQQHQQQRRHGASHPQGARIHLLHRKLVPDAFPGAHAKGQVREWVPARQLGRALHEALRAEHLRGTAASLLIGGCRAQGCAQRWNDCSAIPPEVQVPQRRQPEPEPACQCEQLQRRSAKLQICIEQPVGSCRSHSTEAAPEGAPRAPALGF